MAFVGLIRGFAEFILRIGSADGKEKADEDDEEDDEDGESGRIAPALPEYGRE